MLYLHNTSSSKKERVVPLEKNLLKIYSCGPTIYDFAHVGNLSAYLFADLLKRYLKYKGYKIIDVMNFTDVDDKTIKASQNKGVKLQEYTQVFADSILEDFKRLNIIRPKIICKATEHIKEMINLISILIEKGYAYQSDDKSVYFKISKFRDYGKFAGIAKRDLLIGASGRVNKDEYGKENASDFVLWKAWNESDGVVYWDSPWGKGRPGWHIECSAMSMKYLGPTFDIHTGAIDLIFPHHQNEIAQSEAATGKRFVRYWLHRGFLLINNQKMSKSLGNVYTLSDLLKKVPDTLAFRYLVLTSQYRQSLNFTFVSLEGASKTLKRLRDFTNRVLERQKAEGDNKIDVDNVEKLIKKSRNDFLKCMDDDLDTPKAIACFFDFVNKVNKLINKNSLGVKGSQLILKYIEELDEVWGFQLINKNRKINEAMKYKIEKLIELRNIYRNTKQWEKADEIRLKLDKLGVTLLDSADGTIYKNGE